MRWPQFVSSRSAGSRHLYLHKKFHNSHSHVARTKLDFFPAMSNFLSMGFFSITGVELWSCSIFWLVSDNSILTEVRVLSLRCSYIIDPFITKCCQDHTLTSPLAPSHPPTPLRGPLVWPRPSPGQPTLPWLGPGAPPGLQQAARQAAPAAEHSGVRNTFLDELKCHFRISSVSVSIAMLWTFCSGCSLEETRVSNALTRRRQLSFSLFPYVRLQLS